MALFEIAGQWVIQYWNIRVAELLFVSVMSYRRKGCINWLSTRVCLQIGPCTCVWVLVSGRMCHPSPTACKDASSSVR